MPSSVVQEEGATSVQASTTHARMVGKELLEKLHHVQGSIGEDLSCGYLDKVELFLSNISL